MDYGKFLVWQSADLKDEDGVLVGADITQEWLLPWWWDHYRKQNADPVAFVDFGLSLEMKEWCRERGELLPLRIYEGFLKEKEEVDSQLARDWEEVDTKQCWEGRKTWFKKPLACLQSRFRRTIWIDADCEIRGSIRELFQFADGPSGLGMAKDQLSEPAPYTVYNSGVIVFRRNLDLVVQWAQDCLEQNGLFRGDQDVVSHLIAETKIVIDEIPPRYNWNRRQKDHAEAIILHWLGAFGKQEIRNRIHASEWSYS